MKIRPLNSHVLIAIPNSRERRSATGLLHIPDSAHEDKLVKAKVIAVGNGRWSEKSGVRETLDHLRPGMIVLVDDAILNVKGFPAWQLKSYEKSLKGDETLHLIQSDAIRAEDVEATESEAATAGNAAGSYRGEFGEQQH